MLRGINHVTFAVRDLERSIEFYDVVLQGEVHARWDRGAYLSVGDCWICLTLDQTSSPAQGYSHIAFSIDAADLDPFGARLAEHKVVIWQQNTSEGDSIYFLDPDGHQLEAHVGDLSSRLKAVQAKPYDGQRLLG